MIITDAVLFHVPVIVLLYGSISPHPDVFAAGYNVMERIQLVGFCLQELIISGIYVWETSKMLRLRTERHHQKILYELLVINIIILILDIAVVGIEYAGYYAVQVMFKPVAYSIKLKLEYAILGKLVEVAKGSSHSDPTSSGQGFHPFGSDHRVHSNSGECTSDLREIQTPPSILVHSEYPRHDSLTC
ncbi:hypothetical protein MW887_009990 [Aspergillus wentii]|nr:hypothetical protein MW887_009990 [Aspergillus wentii]